MIEDDLSKTNHEGIARCGDENGRNQNTNQHKTIIIIFIIIKLLARICFLKEK